MKHATLKVLYILILTTNFCNLYSNKDALIKLISDQFSLKIGVPFSEEDKKCIHSRIRERFLSSNLLEKCSLINQFKSLYGSDDVKPLIYDILARCVTFHDQDLLWLKKNLFKNYYDLEHDMDLWIIQDALDWYKDHVTESSFSLSKILLALKYKSVAENGTRQIKSAPIKSKDKKPSKIVFRENYISQDDIPPNEEVDKDDLTTSVLTHEIGSKSNDVEKLEKKIADLKQKCITLELFLKEAPKAEETLEAMLSEYKINDIVVLLEDTQQKLSTQCDQKEEELIDCHLTLSSLECEVSKLKGQIRTASTRLIKKIDTRDLAEERIKAQKDMLDQRLTFLELQIKSFEEQTKNSQTQKTQLLNTLHSLDDKADQLKAQGEKTRKAKMELARIHLATALKERKFEVLKELQIEDKK